jgi:hypothetical protein|uniref:Uncharacterized protein n=1 Tax=Fagus sylvatica TaxID=28930 RepID=A0A7L7T4J9_FAGSY|nr:hypothetical protein [Fagus sylvatica]QOC70526.1 hypothetical protein [Fagus sylvatica]QVG61364.1 hypothetical protein [Fagus sylvatica]QVG61420.1 hypothetical protein [Fagus sylvatica]
MTLLRKNLFRCIRKLVFFCILSFIWDWGFTWVAPLVGVFGGWLDLLLSYMEGFPLSVGGSRNDAAPSSSRRPVPDLNSPPEPGLDLNVTPPSPEPEPDPEPASSSELREARKEEELGEERLRAWADSESYRQLTERLRQEGAWGGEAECQRRDAAALLRLRKRTLGDLEREYEETRARVEVLRRHMRERQKG